MYNLRNRSFLKEIDFTARELAELLRLAAALKTAKYAGTEARRLEGKEIALIFEKTSTRTRSAFEVAAYDQGAHVTYLDPSGSQMGHKESVADTARVLGRMYDAIEFRGAAHGDVEQLAEHAGVPVYNGLTDEWHPTQMLADFLTMGEASRKPYDAISYCYMGDARSNMGRSLLVMGAIMGSDVRLCAPRELWPPDEIQQIARQRAEESGAQGDADRGSRRRPRRGRLRPHRRVGVDGRAEGGLARPGPPAAPLPGQPRGDGQDRQRPRQVHALPAGLPRQEHRRGPPDHGRDRHGRRARGHRRRLRVTPAASSSTRPRTASTRSRPCSSPPSDRRDDDAVS